VQLINGLGAVLAFPGQFRLEAILARGRSDLRPATVHFISFQLWQNELHHRTLLAKLMNRWPAPSWPLKLTT